MPTIAQLQSVIKAVSALGKDSSLKAGMCVIGNHKTGKSLEGHRCPMMREARDGSLSSPLCPFCYAVSCLNNHPATRQYLEREDQPADEIIMNAAGIGRKLAGYPVMPGDRLRVYGLTDFVPTHMPMLRALSKAYRLDIISKTLWMNRKCLAELARLPGVCISLSFNKEIPRCSERMAELMAFVKAERLEGTVSFNYTFTSSYRRTGRSDIEEYRRIPGVNVYHTTQRSKEPLAEAIGDKGVCGILDESGRRIPCTGLDAKGSCKSCGFCRTRVPLPAKEARP